MAYQTTIDEFDTQEEEIHVASSLRHLAYDAVELAELQTELAIVDLQDCARKSALPILVLCVSLCIFLGTTPILLAAIVAAFHVAGFSWGISCLFAGLISLGVATMLAAGGWFWLKPKLRILERSRRELSRNIRWFKRSVKEMQSHYMG